MASEHDGYDRDDRYKGPLMETEMLRALGRLTVNASELESTLANFMWRLLDPNDLPLGMRITADCNFTWLVEHVNALAEYRLSAENHAKVAAWLGECRNAYARRNKIVHSAWGADATVPGRIQPAWWRISARKRSFTHEWTHAYADDVHAVAIELERVGWQFFELIDAISSLRESR